MSADLLARLITAGVDADIIADVARLQARAEIAEAAVAGRRSSDRDRKREQRRREAGGDELSRDVTGRHVTSQDGADNPAPSPSPLLSPHTPQITPHPHPHPEGDTPRARKGWPCPDGVAAEHWRDLLANRRAKRLALTDTAFKGQLREIERLADDEWPPGRLVQHAAEKGWAAIHDPRGNGERQARHGGGQRGIGPTTRAALDFIGGE